MSETTASNPIDVCGAVVTNCIVNALRRQEIYDELRQLHPSRTESSSTVILRPQPCERRTAEENTTGCKGILWEDVHL
jgi:hypothetical protein